MKFARSKRMDPTYAVNKNARILIIDDDEMSASTLAKIIKKAGYAVCITITDPALAVDRFIHIEPDIVLLDLHMEPFSGIEVLRKVGAVLEPRARPPVLVLTADTTLDAKREALAEGATDFLSKPLDHTEVLLRIKHMLETRALFQQCRLYGEKLEKLVDERTSELQKQTGELEKALAELKATQYQVIQQERLQALGTMASGIAHDLNNGLSLIVGYGDMLLNNSEKFPAESKERICLEAVLCAGRDTAQIVRRLREFYRPCAEQEDRQAVNLNDVVEEAIAITAPRWQAKAQADGITIYVAKDLQAMPPISGSPAELREVLTNLIFNSVDAMPRGGQLCFRTRCMGGRARLEVTDTGAGMTDETVRHCLEPFYTTKGERGSGLGLAMSYGIIKRHGGTISIDSRLNEGTIFTIYLPVADQPIEQALSPELKRKICPLRVLVVDDQPGILDIVSAYLVEDRHTVETAADAQEAIDKFHGEEYDLVILDQAMPEINGDGLAAMIKQTHPSEPIIMLTGFADLMSEDGERSKDVDLVLRKPVRLEDLRQAIEDVMSTN